MMSVHDGDMRAVIYTLAKKKRYMIYGVTLYARAESCFLFPYSTGYIVMLLSACTRAMRGAL